MSVVNEFNLTPDARILQMLGEINLDQWKCLAELIDNSVDAFINHRRAGHVLTSPEVLITIPTQDREDAAVTVRDNGPGMTIEQLETAVRAGWSGNNPLDNLGLFGMGFNIATARLGLVTDVYTTRAGDLEWTGLRIDLQELRRTRSYHTPRLTRPKADASVHGTEVKILRLKPEQRTFFSRSANLQKIRRQLSRIYAPILLSGSNSFSLQVNGQIVAGRRQCYWSPDRFVQGSDGRPVHAVETFDFQLPARHYCLTCMDSYTGAPTCPTCGPGSETQELKRRLHGWVGLQRYLDEEDFGLDIVRNGRVIEVQNKDLFVWTGGERPEREYPIDDQRNRGRFIGEIHLDHCRVSYTKDRFERDDAAWQEMVTLVRGEGPLQPQKARALGFGAQDAPLNRLFQAFRRSSPQGRTGRWSKILVVKNNDRAIEMAAAFSKNDPDYQTDEKWYALVEEEDQAVVGAAPSPGEPAGPPPVIPQGFFTDPGTVGGEVQPPGTPAVAEVAAPARLKSHELSRIYKHPLLKVEFNVEAFAVEPIDPGLPPKAPWTLTLDDAGTRTFLFLYKPSDVVFRSVTMTPADALLNELALKTFDFLRDSGSDAAVFSTVLSDLRREYAADSNLDSKSIIGFAESALREIALSVANTSPAPMQEVFSSLPPLVQEMINRKAATKGITTIQQVISDGEFLRYLEADHVRWLVASHPEWFFDGVFWDQPYAAIDLGSEAVTEDARRRVGTRFDAYLADAVWLATQSPRDLDRADRDELIRATLSVRILGQDGPA